MMRRCFGKFTRLGCVVLACSAPHIVSFGDDLPHRHVPPVPTKNPPQAVTSAGELDVYNPTWLEGQPFRARVQLTLAQANGLTDAFVCFSFLGTPVASPSAHGTLTCTGAPNIVQWSRLSTVSTHLNNNDPNDLKTNWVTLAFTPQLPPGNVSSDGTGKGIIIITTGGSQVVVNGTMELEHIR
jgi:hypothetical protein